MSMACQYFSYEKYDQEDDKSEISALVLLDEVPYKIFDDLNDENEPSLADSPLDQDKKELSTFDLTEEVDSRTEL